jgi:hypothetical protein
MVLLRKAEEVEHHLGGIVIGEGAHELAGAGRGEVVDEIVHDRPHPGTELVDGVWGEGLADEPAEAVMPLAFVDVEDDVTPHLGHGPVGDALVGQVVGAALAEATVAENGRAFLVAEDGRSQRSLRVPVTLCRVSHGLGVDPEVGGQQIQRGRGRIERARCSGGNGFCGHGSPLVMKPHCASATSGPSARGRRRTGRRVVISRRAREFVRDPADVPAPADGAM